MNDKELISLIVNSPSLGLEQALKQYGGLVRTIVARILPGRHEDIEECLLDTFTKLWHAREKMADENINVKAYLICIARNTAINRYHHIKRHSNISLDESLAAISGDKDLVEIIEERQEAQELWKVITDLKEPDKTFLIRKYFLFEPVKEIAEKTGYTPTQIRNRLQYTKRVMKTTMDMGGVVCER